MGIQIQNNGIEYTIRNSTSSSTLMMISSGCAVVESILDGFTLEDEETENRGFPVVGAWW